MCYAVHRPWPKSNHVWKWSNTLACQISGHSFHAFSRNCPETSTDMNRQMVCWSVICVMVGWSDGQTYGQLENIINASSTKKGRHKITNSTTGWLNICFPASSKCGQFTGYPSKKKLNFNSILSQFSTNIHLTWLKLSMSIRWALALAISC